MMKTLSIKNSIIHSSKAKEGKNIEKKTYYSSFLVFYFLLFSKA